MKNLLIFLLIVSLANTDELYKKVVNNIDTEAVCLDGSPGVLYYHEGT